MAKLKDLNPCYYKKGVKYNPFFEYQNLIANNIDISNVTFKEKNIIIKNLFDGYVGYDKLTKNWTKITPYGIDKFGYPTMAHFLYANGQTVVRPLKYEPSEDGAYIIIATLLPFSFNDLIKQTTDFMANCDVAINQNINACKTPYILSVVDEETKLSLKQILEQKESGESAIIVNKNLLEALKSIDLNVPFLADKFTQLKYDERDRLLNKLGILTANTDKKERVQVGEVNATINQCSDYIYMLIDAFNKQMQDYDLPFKMSFNGSMEELYEEQETTPEQAKNELQKEQNNDN